MFSPAHADGLEVWFRAPAGRMPGVLEIGMRGRRHPRVEAYWDGSPSSYDPAPYDP